MSRLPPVPRDLPALALASAAAWVALALRGSGDAAPAICAGAWRLPDAQLVAASLGVLPPGGLVAGWALMVAAMMLPTLAGPLGHLHDRSFRRLRPRVKLAFVAGWGAVWLAAGVPLLAAAVLAGLAVPDRGAAFAAALLLALAWQAAPARQRALNRCHRRPDLRRFAPGALADAAAWGAGHALWCLGGCWALMLAMLLAPGWHLPLMAAAALVLWSERIERPAPARLRPRLPTKALRIARHALRPRAAGPAPGH